MRKKFQGCLVGAVLGDCLGAPFEMMGTTKIERILEAISPTGEMFKNRLHKFSYTDDTAMTKSVCASLLAQKRFDAKDMASRFAKEYQENPGRGYGSGVVTIFDKWKDMEANEDVYKPSQEQFDGHGSYGNGAAMRVAPVALFCGDAKEVIKTAKDQALLTHSAKHGYNGSILQAVAVYHALRLSKSFTVEEYINELISVMKTVEDSTPDEAPTNVAPIPEKKKKKEKWSRSPYFTYVKQLKTIQELLTKEETAKIKDVVTSLGNDITAQEAVPAAIYSFLRNYSRNFEETIYYAISLGGDTDTIASMAGAIAGAYFGIDNIPPAWLQYCENVKVAMDYADQFFEEYCKKNGLPLQENT